MAPANNHNDDELVTAAGNNKPSRVRSLLAQAPPARVHTAWPAAVAAAAGAGDAYVMEMLLQHGHDCQLPPTGETSAALDQALMLAAGKGHGGVAALLLKLCPKQQFAPPVIEAALRRALRGDHADVLQALLDRAKPDPYVCLSGDDGEGEDEGQQTPLELAVAEGRQRCAVLLQEYEAIWRQRTLQLLIRATLVESSRLSLLPFAVIASVVLPCLAGKHGAKEPAHSINEPVRGGKRELEDEDDDINDDGEEFPPVAFLQQHHHRGRKRRKPGGRRRSSGGGAGSKTVVAACQDEHQQQPSRRVLRPRKAKTWSEMRKAPLPSDSFAGACAF